MDAIIKSLNKDIAINLNKSTLVNQHFDIINNA